MKKMLTLAVAAALSMGMLVGCGAKDESASVKTGMVVMTGIDKSKAAVDADGTAQIESVVVAVLVDEAGKLVDVKIDTAQTKIGFTKEGKISTDLAKGFPSKQELGSSYGMGGSSSIGKEWNEQADAFADYVIGKTVEEVKAIKVSDTTAPTGADLTSSVTIKVGGYIAAIEKAVANAQDLGAIASDELGLGVFTTIAKSKDATAEADGLAQAYTVYTAVSTDKDGKLTSVLIDSSQSNVNFNAKGEITTDLTASLRTKQELGLEYNMLGSSAIGKEWNEQADAFADYVTGKTVAEVKAIKVSDTTAPTGADLTSSVTIKVGDYISNIERAVNSIK